jgi:ribosomal protein S18 acetylase RimI-like enzyme
MEWTVRPFSEADFSAVWALERVRDPGGYASAVTVRQAAALWPDTVLVAEEGDGVAVGFTIGAVSSDPAVGWILRLKVREELRRRGCATALLRAVLDRLRAEGVRTVRLTVAPENLAARALYARLGFLDEAMLPDYFGPGEDRLVLALRL